MEATKKINIDMNVARFGEGTEIDPMLQPLLLELQHRHPEMNFVASDGRPRWGDTAGSVWGVNVFYGPAPAGCVIINRHKKNNTPVYEIRSDSIVRKRGSDNVRVTKLFKAAVRIAEDVLKPRPLEKDAEQILDTMNMLVAQAWANVFSTASSALRGSTTEVTSFLQDVLEGAMPEEETKDELLAKLGQSWKETAQNLRIMSAVRECYHTKYGAVLRAERDGTLAMVDISTGELTRPKTTYELPTNYQEKLAMLKLIGLDQPIMHVGFSGAYSNRINSITQHTEYFFLIAGETYTDC